MFDGLKAFGLWHESSAYFLSETASIQQESTGQPMSIPPRDAKRLRLFFLFPLLDHLREKPMSDATRLQNLVREAPAAEIACQDLIGRELKATTRLYERIVPREQQESLIER